MSAGRCRAVVEEMRFLWSTLRERFLLVLFLTLLAVHTLLLQLPLRFFLDVGAGLGPGVGNSFDHLVGYTFEERVGRPYDEVFLEGFYPEEQGGDFTFRWSKPQAGLVVRGVGSAPMLLRLRMHGAPGGQNTVQVLAGGQGLAQFPVVFPLHEYAVAIDPAHLSGDELRLALVSVPFAPGGDDPRALGVALDQVSVVAQRWGENWARPTALLLAGVAAFLYLGLRRAGVGVGHSAWAAASVGTASAVSLGLAARPFVAAYAWGLFVATALSYPVLVLSLRLAAGLLERSAVPPDRATWRWLAVLFLVCFVLTLGGALSPRYASHDGPFHANRIEFAERGLLFFEHVSIEAGLRSDPYPSLLYLLLAPASVWGLDRDALLAFVVAWCGASALFLVWFLARYAAGVRASRWAALLYVLFPIGPAAFWYGIYSNLFAVWLVLLVAVGVVLALQGRFPLTPVLWIPLWAMFCLGHFGTLILWLPAVLLWGGLQAILGNRWHRVVLGRLALAGLVGLALASLLYYSYFGSFFMSVAQSFVGALTGQGADQGAPLLSRALAELRVWWRWGVVADYAGAGLLMGSLGLVALLRRWGSSVVGLMLSMVAMALFFWAVSMGTFYFTRYMLFLQPVAALGGGALLSAMQQRGRAGRVLAAVLLCYTGAITVAMWAGLCLLGLRPPHVL